MLKTHGYEVVVAKDGHEGIKLAEKENPALILVDVQMPGLNGLETTAELRKIEACAKTPIIALTAHADKYKRELYMEAGCTDYQQKQAGIKPMLTLVKRYLE